MTNEERLRAELGRMREAYCQQYERIRELEQGESMTDWGKVIVTLRAENARLRAALSMVEHVTVNLYPTNISAVCLWCGQKVEDGHRDDCLRQIALEVAGAPSDPA